MTPIHQIKKLAGSFVFNQFLYPRENLISDSAIINNDQISRYLIDLYGDEQGKLNFALTFCDKTSGSVLDLANGSHLFSLGLVKTGLAASVIESCPSRISAIRIEREQLTQEQQSRFQIYPLELSKFEVDETFQTIFASHQALEQSESEFSLLGTLRNVLSHLTPDGSFFVEAHNLDFFDNQWNFREGVWSYISDRMKCNPENRIWEKTYSGPKESQTIFEFATANSLSEFSLHRSTLHLFNQDQWMKLFEVAGFVVEDCYGSWQKSPVNSQLPQLIFHLKAR